jgi:hypothetical protein
LSLECDGCIERLNARQTRASADSQQYYRDRTALSEPASIRWLNRSNALEMAFSSSHTRSCIGVANGSDLPGSKPKERMDDCES